MLNHVAVCRVFNNNICNNNYWSYDNFTDNWLFERFEKLQVFMTDYSSMTDLMSRVKLYRFYIKTISSITRSSISSA